MAAIDTSLDQVFQEWDDKRIKLRTGTVEQQAEKLGPWAKLVGQRLQNFSERWRPDRMHVIKKLGKTEPTADSIRSTLTPLARDEFLSDLRTWGVPDRYATAAGSLVEVK